MISENISILNFLLDLDADRSLNISLILFVFPEEKI